MGNSTFSGPVRSENGFQTVNKNSTTGAIENFTPIMDGDLRRFALEERFLQRPALNADIDQVYTVEVARAANKNFEVLGTNMTTALATFSATRASVNIATAGADEDQAIIAPHLDTTTDQTDCATAWNGIQWGTENQVKWQASITTNAIDNQKIWAGLKLTNDQLIATDADQAYFKFQTDATNSEAFTDYTLLHFVHSIGGTDYISALPITVTANTTYHLGISINAAREATIFVNGIQYNVTATAGSTGGTAVTSVNPDGSTAAVRTAALTNDVDFIPYIGIEAGAAAAESLDVSYEGISRIILE
jgi:hypothetical protein